MGLYDINSSSLTVNFSNTKPDEPCYPSGDIFIDYDGSITKLTTTAATIVIRGGDDLSSFAVSPLPPNAFYMTAAQRVSLMRLIQGMSIRTDRGSIQSNNGDLKEMCNAIYGNYNG